MKPILASIALPAAFVSSPGLRQSMSSARITLRSWHESKRSDSAASVHAPAQKPPTKILRNESIAQTHYTMKTIWLLILHFFGCVSLTLAGTQLTYVSGADIGKAVAVQTDGKIVLAGAAGSGFAVLRYESSGVLDPTFSPGGTEGSGVAVFYVGGADSANAVAIQSDGKTSSRAKSAVGSWWHVYYLLARWTPPLVPAELREVESLFSTWEAPIPQMQWPFNQTAKSLSRAKPAMGLWWHV